MGDIAPCPTCNEPIAKNAKSCPYCGEQSLIFDEDVQEKVRGCLGCLAFVVAVGIAIGLKSIGVPLWLSGLILFILFGLYSAKISPPRKTNHLAVSPSLNLAKKRQWQESKSTGFDMEENNYTREYNYRRVKDRSMDELIGIARGILFDGVLTQSEAENLYKWMLANKATARHPLGNKLFRTLDKIIPSGQFSSDNEKEIINQLTALTGEPSINMQQVNASTTLPFCKNPPAEIKIKGSHFVLTGNFIHAKRKDVEAMIKSKGGFVKKNANNNSDYLVIGEMGSDAWIHSSFGRKIEEAVRTRDKGGMISIISEAYFFKHIK